MDAPPGKYLPDHLQRWRESLRVWVCMGWSLPLVETKQEEGKKLSRCTFPTVLKQPYSEARLYLEHNDTDLLDTLNDGLWGPCNGDGTLCWVGQHVPCYLYLSSCWLQKVEPHDGVTHRLSKIGNLSQRWDATHLSDFLDFAATFANEWATLTGRHNKANGDRWFAGGRTVRHRGAYVLDRKWR